RRLAVRPAAHAADLHAYARAAARSGGRAVRADRGRQARRSDRRSLSARAGPAGARGPRVAQDDRKAAADPVKELQGWASAELDVPVKACFELLASVESYPDWFEVVHSVEVLEAERNGTPGLARAEL